METYIQVNATYLLAILNALILFDKTIDHRWMKVKLVERFLEQNITKCLTEHKITSFSTDQKPTNVSTFSCRNEMFTFFATIKHLMISTRGRHKYMLLDPLLFTLWICGGIAECVRTDAKCYGFNAMITTVERFVANFFESHTRNIRWFSVT